MRRSIEYHCLCCGGRFLTNKHSCIRDVCEPENHKGWCIKCTQLLKEWFARHIDAIHRKPRLRLEDGS